MKILGMAFGVIVLPSLASFFLRGFGPLTIWHKYVPGNTQNGTHNHLAPHRLPGYAGVV